MPKLTDGQKKLVHKINDTILAAFPYSSDTDILALSLTGGHAFFEDKFKSPFQDAIQAARNAKETVSCRR